MHAGRRFRTIPGARVRSASGGRRETFDGTFSISFGSGAGGTNELSFAGSGLARHLGTSTVEGASLLAQIDALCTEIAEDAVTLTAADGAELFLVNVGTECLNPSTFTIEGAGTGEVVGGTGRFEGATGTLTWEVPPL